MSKKEPEIDVGGRPTKYDKKNNEQARKLCLLGYTDKKLADFFEIAESTLNNWKQAKDGFMESIASGREIADANVAASLYERAIGYSHKKDHISVYQGEATITETIEHYAPDPTAARYWLNNRQRATNSWRDKQEMELSGDGITLNLNYKTNGD